MMHTGKDELEAFKLDEAFKENLALIRPHIVHIKSITDANLCRIWLERLNTCSAQERELRNAFISELRSQVEAGILKPPFTSPPCDGSLVPFTTPVDNKLQEGNFQQDDSSWSDLSVATVCQLYYDTEGKSGSSSEDHLSIVSAAGNQHAQCLQLQQFKERMVTDQALINQYKKDEMKQITQVQIMYEKKIASLKSEIRELKNENKNLHQTVENLQQCQEEDKTHNCDWNSLREEINNLKTKLAKAENSKEALEESKKEVIAHYEREMGDAIHHLCHRLNDAQFRNKNIELQLQAALDQLEKLLDQLRREKHEAALEDSKAEENSKECDANSRVMNLKNLVALKSEEVKQLEAILKTQCFKMQEQVNFIKDDLKIASEKKEKKFRAKVSELQKIVDKHSRIKAKLLKNYNDKLCCIQKERHFEVKGLELQLHTQRAEIVAAMSQDKHKELEMVVAKLEERYKDMIMEMEMKFNSRHDEDQLKISQLEAELSQLSPKTNLTI